MPRTEPEARAFPRRTLRRCRRQSSPARARRSPRAGGLRLPAGDRPSTPNTSGARARWSPIPQGPRELLHAVVQHRCTTAITTAGGLPSLRLAGRGGLALHGGHGRTFRPPLRGPCRWTDGLAVLALVGAGWGRTGRRQAQAPPPWQSYRVDGLATTSNASPERDLLVDGATTARGARGAGRGARGGVRAPVPATAPSPPQPLRCVGAAHPLWGFVCGTFKARSSGSSLRRVCKSSGKGSGLRPVP